MAGLVWRRWLVGWRLWICGEGLGTPIKGASRRLLIEINNITATRSTKRDNCGNIGGYRDVVDVTAFE